MKILNLKSLASEAKYGLRRATSKINYNVFWAIGGSLIGAILITIGCARFGLMGNDSYDMAKTFWNKKGFILLPIINEAVVISLVWIANLLTIVPLFFNNKQVKNSVFFSSLTLQVFAMLLVIFELLVDILGYFGGKSGLGINFTYEHKVMLILTIVGFFIFDLISEVIWKVKGNNSVDKNSYNSNSFTLNNAYSCMTTMTIAILTTVLAYSFGTLTNGKATDLTWSVWASYKEAAKVLTIICVTMAWLGFISSILGAIFYKSKIRNLILIFTISFVAISALLIISTIAFDLDETMNIINRHGGIHNYSSFHKMMPKEVSAIVAYSFGAVMNLFSFIIIVVGGSIMFSKYIKGMKKQ